MTIELDVNDAALVQVCLSSHYASQGRTMGARAQRIRDRIDIAAAAEYAVNEAVTKLTLLEKGSV